MWEKIYTWHFGQTELLLPATETPGKILPLRLQHFSKFLREILHNISKASP
jgi:hypothetical protein